jgi:hypothetical protein
MRCGRCRSLMVVDHFLDLQDSSGHLWLRAWRCVICGEVVEPGILQQRFVQRSRLARFVERLTRRSPKTCDWFPSASERQGIETV